MKHVFRRLRDFHNNTDRRPYRHIAVLLPVALIYFPLKALVELIEKWERDL